MRGTGEFYEVPPDDAGQVVRSTLSEMVLLSAVALMNQVHEAHHKALERALREGEAGQTRAEEPLQDHDKTE